MALLSIVDASWRLDWPRTYRAIQWSGLLLIPVCIWGRTWCTLYIGGMQRRELVTRGPYSVVRNPLYLFTLLGAAGIGALSAALAWPSCARGSRPRYCYLSCARRSGTCWRPFRSSIRPTPPLIPRFSLWQDADPLIVKPPPVHRTFLDASLFLMAVPMLGFEPLVRDGLWLPVLLHLP